jgi:DNA polymerase III epsilon subunit-like protein
MKNKICVFDFETDGADPTVCSPVQIAAVIIDPYNLEVIRDSEFNISVKPDLLEKDPNHDYSNSDILDFHARVRGCTGAEILESWKNNVSQQQAWQAFNSYLLMYHYTSSGKKSQFTAPIAAGYNIHRFDLKIVDRYAKQFGYVNKENTNNLFYPRDVLDIMNLVFYWFENISDVKSLSLDNMRDYLGISKAGAHDALKDVKDCANMLCRFMKLHRNLSQKVKFKDAFTESSEI